jgi:hypothetical protein
MQTICTPDINSMPMCDPTLVVDLVVDLATRDLRSGVGKDLQGAGPCLYGRL